MGMKTAISRAKAKRNLSKQRAMQTRAAVRRSKHGRPFFTGKVKQAGTTQGK